MNLTTEEYVEQYRSQLKKVSGDSSKECLKLARLAAFLGSLVFRKNKLGGYKATINHKHLEDTVAFYVTLYQGESTPDHVFFINYYTNLLSKELLTSYEKYEWPLRSIQSSENQYNSECFSQAVMLNACEALGYDANVDCRINIFTDLTPS